MRENGGAGADNEGRKGARTYEGPNEVPQAEYMQGDTELNNDTTTAGQRQIRAGDPQ